MLPSPKKKAPGRGLTVPQRLSILEKFMREMKNAHSQEVDSPWSSPETDVEEGGLGSPDEGGVPE